MAGRRRVAATRAARAEVIAVGSTAEIAWAAADDSACDAQSCAPCSPTPCTNGGICRKRGIDDAAFCDVGPSQSIIMGCTDHNRRRYAKVHRRIGGGRVLPRPTDERRFPLRDNACQRPQTGSRPRPADPSTRHALLSAFQRHNRATTHGGISEVGQRRSDSAVGLRHEMPQTPPPAPRISLKIVQTSRPMDRLKPSNERTSGATVQPTGRICHDNTRSTRLV
jgi:hypothetical protein